MATVNTRGFTIVETMLFLGISGALFAVLMVGMNNNLIQQRYRESVQNYVSLLQSQYASVANTRIERESNLKCTQDGGRVIVNDLGTEGDIPGAPSTDPACVILGKAIQLETRTSGLDTGTVVRIYPVIGIASTGNDAVSDIDAIKSYKPAITDTFSTVSSPVDWGSYLYNAGSASAGSRASFLILRSPSSGLVRVYASNGQLESNLSDMITEDNAKRQVKNCMDGQRGLLPKQMIVVDAKIAGQNGVRITDDAPECQ